MKQLFLIGFLFLSLASWAGDKGNGGDVVILPDDTIVLADPFGIIYENEPLKADILFSDELKAESGRIRNILNSFQADERFIKFTLAELIESYVLGNDIKYYVVSTLPNTNDCVSTVIYPWAPATGRVERAACTNGNETWIKNDLFKKMSIRQQGLLLLHEGLRRFKPRIPDTNIYKITVGMNVALDHFNKQILGLKEELTSKERTIYLVAVKTLLQLKISNLFTTSDGQTHDNSYIISGLRENDPALETYSVFKNGGGIIRSSDNIGQNTFLGIGVTLNIPVGNDVTLINTNIAENSFKFINDKVVVINSTFHGKGYLGEKVVIKNSSIYGQLYMLEGSKILNSNIAIMRAKEAGKLILHKKSSIENVTLSMRHDASDSIQSSFLIVNERASLKNIKSGDYTYKSAGLLKKLNKHPTINVEPDVQLNLKNEYLCDDKNYFEKRSSNPELSLGHDFIKTLISLCKK